MLYALITKIMINNNIVRQSTLRWDLTIKQALQILYKNASTPRLRIAIDGLHGWGKSTFIEFVMLRGYVAYEDDQLVSLYFSSEVERKDPNSTFNGLQVWDWVKQSSDNWSQYEKWLRQYHFLDGADFFTRNSWAARETWIIVPHYSVYKAHLLRRTNELLKDKKWKERGDMWPLLSETDFIKKVNELFVKRHAIGAIPNLGSQSEEVWNTWLSAAIKRASSAEKGGKQ